MHTIIKPDALPKAVQELLDNAECKQYIVFSSGACFHLQGSYSPDQKRILYGLKKEYSALGAALVEAIWFAKSVKLLLVCGQRVLWSEASVYKCHIAGPLFTDNLLRVRSTDAKADIASSWELRASEWKEGDTAQFQDMIANAFPEPQESPFEEQHLDLQLL